MYELAATLKTVVPAKAGTQVTKLSHYVQR